MPIDPEVAAELDLVRQHLGVIQTSQDAISAEIAIIDQQRDGIMTSIGRITVLLEGAEPEPPSYPVPASVELTPGPAELVVSIAHPASIPSQYDYMVIAWGGSQGFIDAQTYSQPFPVEETISGLPIEQIHVDVGYGINPDPVPSDKLVRATGTPDAPAGTGEWPATGDWVTEKIPWIEARAGIKVGAPALKPISGNVPSGCQWDGRTLHVREATLLQDLDIPGRIYVRAVSGNPAVTIRNVKAEDVFSSESGADRVSLVEDCEFTMPAHRVTGSEHWGQGNLNAMRDGFIVRRTLCRGAADNMQCSPGTGSAAGLLEECVFRDMTIDQSWTHNDFIQLYGGRLNIRRCYFRQNVLAGQENHLNGIFADGGTYDIEDTAIIVTAPQGSNSWAIHAGKYQTSNQIVVRNSYVRGRRVGQYVFTNVDYAAGY